MPRRPLVRSNTTSDADGIASPVLEVSSRGLVTALWLAPLAIVLLDVVGHLYLRAFGAETVLGSLRLLRLREETSVCGWYSTLLLAAIAGLLVLVGRTEAHARWRPYWLTLACVFAFLSFDEAVAFHERWVTLFSIPSLKIFGGQWVVPYLLLTVVLGLVFLRFVLAQAEPLRSRIVVAGAVYVGSALGLEMLESYVVRTYGITNTYKLLLAAQEVGEMIGLTLFAVALIAALRDLRPPLSITLR